MNHDDIDRKVTESIAADQPAQKPEPEKGCHDRNCKYTKHLGGMRTNGGCHCDDTKPEPQTENVAGWSSEKACDDWHICCYENDLEPNEHEKTALMIARFEHKRTAAAYEKKLAGMRDNLDQWRDDWLDQKQRTADLESKLASANERLRLLSRYHGGDGTVTRAQVMEALAGDTAIDSSEGEKNG